MRIGIIHATCNAVTPVTEIARLYYPDVAIVNFVNEYLLDYANKVGGVDDFGLRQFAQILSQAEEAQLDGIIIACTIYSPYAEYFQPMVRVPLIGIDRAMIEAAVDQGGKIGIIGTTAPSVPAVKLQMEEYAKEKNIALEIVTRTVTAAMANLEQGRTEEHDRLIREAAEGLVEEGCDTIVLSQITMARVKPLLSELNVTVFTSPEEGLARMCGLINGQ